MQEKKSREIGSEFWEVPQTSAGQNTVFPPQVQWYLSGSSALQAILQDILKRTAARTAALPSWCCRSMILPFVRNHIDVRFYEVVPGKNGGLALDFSGVPDCDILFIMDYFGYRRKYAYPDFRGIVIRDLTQSVFCGAYADADYCFGSLRKWAGFKTGGFAWKRDGSPLEELTGSREAAGYLRLRRHAMSEKEAYIKGLHCSKAYLDEFGRAEEILENGCTGGAYSEDVAAARCMDVQQIRECRRQNAEQLLEKLSELAVFPTLEPADCPLFVPISLPRFIRDGLRRKLIENEIYCPIHWPVSALHRLTGSEQMLYDTELSLVCDQRYSPEDISRECDTILRFLKNNKQRYSR